MDGEPELTQFLRDVDGTGSLHPCLEGDPGAIEFVRMEYARGVVLGDLSERPSAVAEALINGELAPPAWPNIAQIYAAELAGSLASVTLAGMQGCIDAIQEEMRNDISLTDAETSAMRRCTKRIADMIAAAKAEMKPQPQGESDEAGQG